MKSLNLLLQKIPIIQKIGSTELMISEIIFDSRKAVSGALFCALKGSTSDGHSYIEKVIESGVTCILCEVIPEKLPNHVTFIQVADSHACMAQMASAFFDYPSEKMQVTAVTGTNGKTTVATLLFRLFRAMGHSCGLLSTVQNQINETVIPSTHTTPDSISLQFLLNQMLEAGVEYVFMEASSHAIDQKRIGGLKLAGAVFTNITHDHLDYHKTFDHYLKTKKQLFDTLPTTAFALVNKDDRNGLVMTQNCKGSRYTYALQSPADFKAKLIEADISGMQLEMDGVEAWFRLSGKFNAYNLLAVYGAAFLLGKNKIEIIQHLSEIEAVKGRFECVRTANGVTGIVDYAHTPDALDNILQTIQHVRKGNEILFTIIGCGGNRDAEKRPKMASIAAQYSDQVILTSDNPRNENPEIILDQMMQGLSLPMLRKSLRISDRKEAIRTAASMARPGDIILLAGKGHENYQEVNGIKHPFDDKAILTEMLSIYQSEK